MSAALALALALAATTSSTGGHLEAESCAIEACPPEVIRRMWLTERTARLRWEAVAAHRARLLEALRAELAERGAIPRSPEAAAPCPSCPAWPWVSGGSCAACASAAAAACVVLSH